MAIVVVLAGSYLGYQRLSDSGCTGSVKLTVAAAAEIAPAIDQTAQRWIKDGANLNGTCVAVTVAEVNPANMAAAVATEHKVVLPGLGAAPNSVKVPDVWVADSSTWLQRLQAEAPGFQPTDNKPLAQSPIVVAMPKPIAETVGWPDKKLGWADLLSQITKSTTLRTGIVNPSRDAAGLSSLLALGQAAGTDIKSQQAKVFALQSLAQSTSALRDDLLQKFPHSADANDIATSLSAAPLSEEDVVSYNAEKPPIPLIALYLEPNPPPLDYPYAIMPEVDPQKASVAALLRAQLQSASFKNALATSGLRSPDGSTGAGFAAPLGAPQASPAIPVDAGGSADGGKAASGIGASTLSQALGSWNAITQPGRVLAVFDVSGSMLRPVPTAKGLNRAQVTQIAAKNGLAMFNDKWSVGVWLFSTNMKGSQPYLPIEPIRPLSSARADLVKSVDKIVPRKLGETGLYNTALAAYKSVQDTWEPGKVNSVILFTDGKNENEGGLTRNQLVTELKKLNDPTRPVRMVIIGIGTEVDSQELQDITDATPAGGVFISPDPAKMSDVFLQAIGTRTGAKS
ncbi:substrate-binding domain-containing protein [Micromonosporaceae bacterium Da 78-11]